MNTGHKDDDDICSLKVIICLTHESNSLWPRVIEALHMDKVTDGIPISTNTCVGAWNSVLVTKNTFICYYSSKNVI